jgi:hypothetical protein
MAVEATEAVDRYGEDQLETIADGQDEEDDNEQCGAFAARDTSTQGGKPGSVGKVPRRYKPARIGQTKALAGDSPWVPLTG